MNVTRDGNVHRNPQILEKIKMKWGEVYTRPSGPLEETGDVSLVPENKLGPFWGQTPGRTHGPQLSGTCRLPRSVQSPASDLF